MTTTCVKCGLPIVNVEDYLLDCCAWECRRCGNVTAPSTRVVPKELRCSTCGKYKPREEFVGDLHGAACHNEYRTTCNACHDRHKRGKTRQQEVRRVAQ